MKCTLAVLILLVLLHVIYTIISTYHVIRRSYYDEYYKNQYNDRKVTTESRDKLELTAFVTNKEENDKGWVIIVHRMRGSNMETYRYDLMEYYLQSGYNVLCPNCRGHGDSQGDYIGLSYLDAADILCWIEYLNKNYNKPDIILHGFSMGASAVLSVCDVDTNISAIISDSAFHDMPSFLEYNLRKKLGIPSKYFVDLTGIGIRLVTGIDIYDCSPKMHLQSSKVPILFLHGAKDSVVPVSDVYLLFDECNSYKELKVFDQYDHIEAWKECKELYWSTIDKFLTNLSL